MTAIEQAMRTIAREEAERRFMEIISGSKPKKTNGRATTRKTRKLTAGDSVECAIIDCGLYKRSKGFCSKHYQKFRMLAKRDELPTGWKENAKPNSIEDVVLPRGRAAHKAKA